ncbi:pyrroloquinoline quinone-dependent dehydrogenase [Aestuariicella hydrocarbonica]|uniref:Pyrroloquinoline quinone-dependent dehydrogenase n=1 Tax=Pseudomaricurvus hydrocarbonicus TaxID=1470433 RepID=A0A9E5JUF8_9GAMM|nr:pyrroloquinoline quinone-dependent dehydrogenase [Aestuariicella hydrocarbonica]NHO65686.1 pyrroloquinoline quinone-dependent dehydrogenase [Aestuariicella hydrocarbonica]
MQKNKNTRLFQCKRTLFSLIAGITVAAIPLAGNAGSETDQHQLGTKYSPLTQINKDNVANLELAWEFNTGDLPAEVDGMSLIAFEDQPSLIEGNLVVCSVKRRLTALDPATGETRWTFDPEGPDRSTKKCRGITSWVDEQAAAGSQCKTRIFLGTSDYRLLAIDAKTGKACEAFGENGAVKMPITKPELFPGEVVATSNPAVVNGVVVVGSAVADMQRSDPPSGRVLAFDARTGAQRWAFDPVPRDANDPAMTSWGKGTESFGQGNVWSSMAVDQKLDLVYLPTTSASDDYYGGDRPGDNHYTSSVVALKGATGEVAWHFQFVHHNVFDYDTPTRPMLIDYPHNGEMVPALVQNTKMGIIYIFNRETGEPLVPIVERPVPQNIQTPGEVLSPTQPFSEGMPTVLKHGFTPNDVWGFTFIDEWLCRNKAEEYHYGPIYTPPSLKGTIMSPSAGGGPNWGGGGYDPDSHIMVVASNRVPTIVTLIPREQALKPQADDSKVEGLSMTFPNPGSKYVTKVEPLLSPTGAPCSEPPWAALTAIDLVKKEIVWEVPLGSIKKMASLPFDWFLGTPGAGGPLVTAGGLVFIGYTLDNSFRAFDMATGETLWETDLPAAGTSIPVTYEVNGEQYIVIPAGGHSMYGSTMGDSVMAYKLKRS